MTTSHGVSSGGTLEFDPFSDDFFNSPYATYRRLRDEAPVYYNGQYNFWALSRYDDVAPALKDFETYSSAKGATMDMINAPDQSIQRSNAIIMLDPPEHNQMRKLVNKVFTPRAMESMESMVRQKIQDIAATLNPESFDVVADFSALFPVEIIATMLGVPAEHRQQVRVWNDKILQRKRGSIFTTPEGMEASRTTGMFYYQLVQERRAKPEDDMISRLIETEIERDGETVKLNDADIAGFATLLGGAGAETVTKLIGNAAVIFADNPAEWQKLRADRSKIPAAVEELLRYEGPSQYNVRFSMRDVTLHGTTIPASSAVMLINGSANRDERVFPEPDRFDVDRERKFGYNLAFGYGIHSCLGAALARMESRIALETLLDLIPEYHVERPGLRRVEMSNVCGWSNVPVRVA